MDTSEVRMCSHIRRDTFSRARAGQCDRCTLRLENIEKRARINEGKREKGNVLKVCFVFKMTVDHPTYILFSDN